MSLQDDIFYVAAYIKQCQTEGSQPYMDYVEAFSRIISHLNSYENENNELRRDLESVRQGAKTLFRLIQEDRLWIHS